MKLSYLYTTLIIIFSLVTFCSINHGSARQKQQNDLIQEKEIRLSNLRQLTFSGENAEAYFSNNGDRLIFQSHDGDSLCDQIYIMNIKTGSINMVSTGEGVTTCSYFVYPDCKKAIYASTHMGNKKCPEKPDYSRGYVWKLYPDYDIFLTDLQTGLLERLTSSPGYDAEATVDFNRSKIIYTSMVSGDLDIWTMDFDGSNKKQITNNGSANFGPYFFPSGDKIIFSSNLHDPKGRDFDLYSINIDGSDLERITFFNGFDGFPMFSPNREHVVFASNRNQKKRGETNLFSAEWNYI